MTCCSVCEEWFHEKYLKIKREALREKRPNTELFLVHIFLHSDWIQRFMESEYSVPKTYLVRIQENTDQK